MAEAEAALNALKKLEVNKTCVNCGNYNRFGHQNICEKVRTFVCSNCKSAHQSYSMRVKSVSMSNWTMYEVDALREQNGGGNAVAARVWLGRWDESQMRKPTKNDPLDYYKQFINRVYNDRAFYDEDGFNAAPSSPNSPSPKTSSRATPAVTAPVSNLLEFDTPKQKKTSNGGFDTFGSTSSSSGNDGWGNFATAPAPVSSDDGFGAFTGAPPANDGFADFSAVPASSDNEAFGAFTSAPPAPTSNSNTFDPFAASGGSVLTPSATSSNGAFDPFAPAPTNQYQNSSANIMKQFNAAPASKDFSVFDGLSAPSLAYGTPQRNNGYGQGRSPAGIGMHGQQQIHMGMGMNIGMGIQQGMGMQQHAGGFLQQQHYQQQQQQQPMGGSAGMNISTYFSPNGVATGGNPGARSNSRDPFAGLGLPQK